MTTPCNACRWRTQAGTCELQLIAGPIGQSVLWCAHVEHCPHDAVRRHAETLARLQTRHERSEYIDGVERSAGAIVGQQVRDAFAALWARGRA